MTNGIGRVGWRNFVPTNNPLWDNLKAYYTADNTPNDALGVYNGTLTNGATYATGKINNGFSFDGVNDYISVSPTLGASFTSPSNSHSYSFWVYPNVLSENKTIINNGNAGMGTIVSFGGSGIYVFYAGVGGLWNAGGGFTINTWYHVVITYTSGVFKMYKNGILFSTSPTISWTDGGGTCSTYIGSYLNGSGLFNGKIDELGAWNRALTSTEVTELYNAGAGKQYVAPTPAYTSRTTAFATATGITDTTILNALNTFDAGLISNGLATKMKALYPFVGGTANTHKYNFMDARDVDAAFRIQFNGGWVHSSTGAKGNGTNTYMNTFLNQFNNFTDWKKSCMGIYSRTNESGLFLEGNYGLSDSNFALYTRLADGRLIFQAGAPFASAVTSNSLGFLSGGSISGSDRRVYKNGVKLATNTETNTFGVLTGLNTYFGALNGSGTATYIGNKDYALAFLGESLTDADQSALYTLTQAFQTTLSRQV